MLRQLRIQKQQFSVLPQQIQLLKLFHLTTHELQQRIQEELNENPLLEEKSLLEDQEKSAEDTIPDYQDEEEYQYDDIPDYKLEHNNYLSESDLPQRPISERYDFRSDLKAEIRITLKNEKQVDLAEYLIDSLNDCGMLERNLEEITDDYSFKKQQVIEEREIEEVRTVLKEMHPEGVGCFTVKEFLLFQLNRMNTNRPDVKMAICLLEKHFDSLACRRKEKIADLLGIDEDELEIVLHLIGSCKSKPLSEIDLNYVNDTVIPDFIIRRTGDNYEITLHHERSATLFINHSVTNLINKQNPADKGATQYLKNKLNSAQWFVDAIKQRESSMQKVMRVIVDLQKNYFKNGDIALLKPMILKNIANRTGLDVSTISRITCNKYADTHFGIIRLKDLFSEGLQNEEGENVSNRVIRATIVEIVKNEDKRNPLTDQQLVIVLSMKGFILARRTVAKYREQLRIPAAHFRAMWVS
jgi:RNA polymerase sigma-54 factor